MAFKIVELTATVPYAVTPRTCGPTVPVDPTSLVCTWVTEDATGFQGGRKASEERLAILKAELRETITVH